MVSRSNLAACDNHLRLNRMGRMLVCQRMDSANHPTGSNAPQNHPRKKRGVVFIVVIASIAIHLLAGGILAVIKITEVLKKEAEFEAPPVQAVKPPPPPPPPPPTAQRTQKSMPRPAPLVAQNPQDMAVPAIEIDRSQVNMLSGRGFGGGLGEIGGGVIETFSSFRFYGMEASGSNFAVIMDMSGSAKAVFADISRELIKTLDAIQGQNANFMLIFFGGREGGRPKEGKDFRGLDFWYPTGVSGTEWLSGSGNAIRRLRNQLQSAVASGSSTQGGSADGMGEAGFFFRQGTQFWGALDAAFSLDPPPDSVFLLVEPRVAFQDTRFTQMSYGWYQKFGKPKPANTKVYVVLSTPKSAGANMDSIRLMVNLLNGGKLNDKKIDELITFTSE